MSQSTARGRGREESGYIPDKIIKAEKRIAAYPYDTEAWSILIRDAQMKRVEEVRPIYERLVAQFPNAGRYWKIYIEQEMKAKNYERVEKKISLAVSDKYEFLVKDEKYVKHSQLQFFTDVWLEGL